MKVELARTRLKVSLPYNEHLVAMIAQVPGRTFNKKSKTWSVPVVHVKDVVEALGPFGCEFSDKVVELYRDQVKFFQKITRLKEGRFTEVETQLLDKTDIPMYAYQRRGAGFMCAVNGLLGDQPGLGKTIQVIAGTQLKQSKKVLIFCPSVIRSTWEEELQKWSPDSTFVVVKGNPKQRLALYKTDVTYYILNYELVLRDLPILKSMEWDDIVCDESTVLANHTAKTTKAIKKLKPLRKTAMTGTPLSNKPDDLWSPMDWLQPGLLGSYLEFVEKYCTTNRYGSVAGYKNLDKLSKIIEPYMLRRLKSEVLKDLPPKIYKNIRVDFTSEERRMYDNFENALTDELKLQGVDNTRNLNSALVKMTRLSQLADSGELVTGEKHGSKLDGLKSLLAILLEDPDTKTIIFTGYAAMAKILERELTKYNPLCIAGYVNDDDRTKNRHTFQEDNKHQIMIMTSAGNMGLNLQRASSVIHYDLPWSISGAEQREDRAHRNGQTGSVVVYRMLVKDTIDEYKLFKLQGKKNYSDTVLGDKAVDTSGSEVDVDSLNAESYMEWCTKVTKRDNI